MKGKLRIAVSLLAMVPLLFVGTASAIEGSTTTTTNDKATTSTSDTAQKQMTAEQKQDLQKRLEERAAKLKLKLSTAEQGRLQSRCKNSQGTLTSLSARINTAQTKRTEVYGGLIARLSALSGKLEKQGVDVTTLQSQITTLRAHIDAYGADVAAYKQTIADLSAMDCAKDPTAFKASLETARTALATVRKDAETIRTYTNNTVKPTLQQLKSQLANSSKQQQEGN